MGSHVSRTARIEPVTPRRRCVRYGVVRLGVGVYRRRLRLRLCRPRAGGEELWAP